MYTFRLTEEIARWAFEVVCQNSGDWYIAFTNPTAGPWKTVKCTDPSGAVGEVYRFELEENRPDILLVNDKMELIMIIEAKDSLAKLITGDQAEKSVKVVDQLADILKGKKSNPFWGKRANYTVLTGLLWGADFPSTAQQREEVFDKYFSELRNYPSLDKEMIVGIETYRVRDGLACKMCAQLQNKGASAAALAPIAESFSLPVIP